MSTEKRKIRMREYMVRRRAEAKESGITIKSDNWASENKEKHRAKTAKWRNLNPEKSAELDRSTQKTRRSTPWGKITNRMWAIIHSGVRRGSSRNGKYNKALGYTWSDLRNNLESMFDEFMTWDNWGEYWELDHVKPISSFRYESINDEEFVFCWSMSNMRPLKKELNQAKGSKND